MSDEELYATIDMMRSLLPSDRKIELSRMRSARAPPRIVRLVRQALERSVIGFIVGLRLWCVVLVGLLLMLLPSPTAGAAARRLGMSAFYQ